MKAFISWSGDIRRAVATSVATSVRDVITNMETWLSPENVEPGQKWWQSESECRRSLPGKEAGV
jgi:hypothetical protein